MIKFKRVVLEGTVHALDGINRRLLQLSPSGKAVPLTLEGLEECLGNKNFYLFVAGDDSGNDAQRLLGMGSIFFQKNLGRWIAEIHDIVVDGKERGRGLGEQIVTELIREANVFATAKKVPIKLYLTSRPTRAAANKLYLKLGFKLVAEASGEWGTNLYKMMLAPIAQEGGK